MILFTAEIVLYTCESWQSKSEPCWADQQIAQAGALLSARDETAVSGLSF